MKTAEDWHHTEKFVRVARESNPQWRCHCASCVHIRRIQADALDEQFHPLKDSDVLNQPGSRLLDYAVLDGRSRTSHVAQLLLRAILLAYLKHCKDTDLIGWEALGDELHNAICEAIGDEEFCKWNDTTSNA